MENFQELIPFAKELLSQKPNRGLLKVYLVGSVFAVLGTVIGLVETVCLPFSSGETMDAENILTLSWEQRTVDAEKQVSEGGQEQEEEDKLAHENRDVTHTMTLAKPQRLSQRNTANRLHAS